MPRRPREIIARLLANRFLNKAMGGLLRGRATIFMLHRIADPTHGIRGSDPELLREALVLLRRIGCNFMPVEELVRRSTGGQPVPPYTVAFTIDDGFADQAEVMAPILLEQQVPLTMFLITGFIDGALWPWHDRLAWMFSNTSERAVEIGTPFGPRRYALEQTDHRRDALRDYRNLCTRCPHERLETMVAMLENATGLRVPAEPPPEYRPTSWDRVRTLAKQGVQFGPHSVTHGIVSRMNDDDAAFELLEAPRRIRAETGDCALIYCWPVGRPQDFTARDIDLVREAGFIGALAAQDDYAMLSKHTDRDDRYRIRRFSFPDDLANVLQYATWMERAKQVLRPRPTRRHPAAGEIEAH
jgi:peptidoglycan/xylan/chitin deacetylase (PgdA/CDA1 family)